MSFKETSSPVPRVQPEDLPDTLSNHILRGFVADLTPQPTTPGIELWTELRYRATGEMNYVRWSDTMTLDGSQHTVALFGVKGEKPNGISYAHSALRCSCSLPDHQSFNDLEEEYQGCPGTNHIISNRVRFYHEFMGSKSIGRIDKDTLLKATVFLLDVVKNDPLAWAPSNRSDRLLVDPLADIYNLPRDKVRNNIQELAQDEVIKIHGQINPSVSLAA